MFKIFSGPRSGVGSKITFFLCTRPLLLVSCLLILIDFAGCISAPPLPKVDLSEPGWVIREGQAVWRPPHKAAEIAGDLQVATKKDGSVFVQFTKTPLPFAIAQTTPSGWQIEFPTQNRRFAAHGSPPARIVWFQLADALAGKPLSKNWFWKSAGDNWQLTNSSSGESLEGYLGQ